MGPEWDKPQKDISFLLDTVCRRSRLRQRRISADANDLTDYSNYTGRMAIGQASWLLEGQSAVCSSSDGQQLRAKVKELFSFEGLGKTKTDEVRAGDICAVSGLEGFDISDTLADPETPEALPTIAIDEPTMSMRFTINDSPFFGKEGKYVTSRHLKDRLERGTEKNLALRVESTDSADTRCMGAAYCTSVFLSRPCAARDMNCRSVSLR